LLAEELRSRLESFLRTNAFAEENPRPSEAWTGHPTE